MGGVDTHKKGKDGEERCLFMSSPIAMGEALISPMPRSLQKSMKPEVASEVSERQ